MNLDDIPVLRHLGLLIGFAKALAMLACLFLFPIMVMLKLADCLQARSVAAKWYFGLQAMGWTCGALAYCLPVLAPLCHFFGHPAIAEGRNWPFLLALFCDARGIDLVLGEIALQCGLSALAFAMSWAVGGQAWDGQFVPRLWLRSE